MAKRTRASARRTTASAPQNILVPSPPSADPAVAPAPKSKSRWREEREAQRRAKGGPVPGTPSPMRLKMSPELQAHVKRLYEETDQPISHIGLDVGVNESIIRRMGVREGWVRYVAPPRDLPPVALLLAEVEALEKSVISDRHPEVLAEGEPRRMATTGAVAHGCRVDSTSDLESAEAGKPASDGAQERAPQGDGDTNSAPPEDNIERLIRVVMAHVDEFEAMRRNGKLLPKHHLENARAINILTEAFNRLQRLRAYSNGPIHDDTFDMPADLDAYRVELARKIEEFLRSRQDIGHGDGAADEAVEGV